MASKKSDNFFSLTLFDIYRKKDQNGPLPEVPTFTWTDRNGASQRLPVLEPEQLDGSNKSVKNKSVKSALQRLYRLAGHVFKEKDVFRTAPQKLLDELQDTKNGTWQVASDLPVYFPKVGCFCFEEKYSCSIIN